MNKFRWALLLAAAACQPPIDHETAMQRQALGGVPPGAANMLALSGGSQTDRFGHALAWGDFNKDGVVDLAVGAPGVSSGSGRVYVYFGPLLAATPASVPLSAAAPGSAAPEFGTALAVTDFNNDGYDDLVVGAPGVMSPDGGTAGAVYFFGGGGAGFSGALQVRGDMLALGLNSAAGSTLERVPPDSVWVGARGALNNGAAVLVTNFAPKAAVFGQPGDSLGTSLLSLDIDGQGKRDLLAGAPTAQTFRGALAPFLATLTVPSGFDAGIRTGGVDPGERFGEVLAAIDEQGVIAIGSPAFDPVNARGRFTVATVNLDGTLDMVQRTDGVTSERLGTALAASDMNGDTKPELYIGAPGANRVATYDPYAFTPLGSLALNMAGAGYSCFGCAIAGGVNAFGDHADDLAVGAEGYSDNVNGIFGGAVMLYAGDAGVAISPVDGGAANDGGTRSDGGSVPAAAIELVSKGGQSIIVRPGAAANLAIYVWDFGDMTPPVVVRAATDVPHDYAIPGGYRVRLSVVTAGGVAEADRQVLIADRFGNLPPTMLCAQKNTATPVPGTFDLTVVAQTDDPAAEVMIDFSEGPVEQSASTTRSFPAGARRVHCYAQNAHGLYAHDSVMARLGDALPTCRMSFVPPAGEGPLSVQHVSDQTGSLVTNTRIVGEDGLVIDEGGLRTYDVGLHHATAEATTLNGGARCVDRGRIFAYPKPAITSTPPQLGCGQPLSYVVKSEGGEPTLSSASPGVTFDSATQTVTAPALLKSNVVSFDVTVANPYAETTQKVSLPVLCSDRLSFDTPVCGCSGGAAGPLGLMLLAFAARRRRR